MARIMFIRTTIRSTQAKYRAARIKQPLFRLQMSLRMIIGHHASSCSALYESGS